MGNRYLIWILGIFRYKLMQLVGIFSGGSINCLVVDYINCQVVDCLLQAVNTGLWHVIKVVENLL